ncbi:hypothetical protein KZP23_06505 [Echinicola marina]|uniref:hypothetical protein n=1 Tax=Echinicola marina TaxID=2859768 RepID=UPI001CF692B9|nr:hypothetical protein [Echinicola marina]UCS94660.1 hypothetical protein KZP23_06505 [Echinicola marina]
MKHLYLLLLLLTYSFGCTTEHKEIEQFSKEIGREKMAALNQLVASYEHFLFTKYPDPVKVSDKTFLFLEDVKDNNSLNIRELPNSQAILELMEASGLRKDIYIYNCEKSTYPAYPVDQLIPITYPENSLDLSMKETYFSEERRFLISSTGQNETSSRSDSILSFNKKGLFMYALAKAKHKDPSFMTYVEVKYTYGDIHPSLFAQKHLEQLAGEELSWFQRLPLVIDIYYKLMLTKSQDEDYYLSFRKSKD